ncbi:MAG: type II toxin-antitoxin system VapC family toxin [Euryarchaeota archaeon]|nr:type II toxin-antitoxin system VapC family toxin [Euryarchaeota archaeon]
MAEDRRLWKEAKEIFELAESGGAVVAVPTIVLAEAFYIAEKKDFSLQFRDILNKVDSSINFPSMSLDMETVKEMVLLNELPEIHDKIITATSRILDATLITKDKEIKASGYVPTV